MSVMPKRLLTAEGYLEIEREAEFKSEFFDGEMFAMAGASTEHVIITSNLVWTLQNQLLDKPCLVLSSDMRVKVNALGKYVYPDVSIVCGEREYDDKHKDTLLNPLVIIEILSGGTEAYDRGKKFEHYQYIESLEEYILIAQDAVRLEHFVRQKDREWTYFEYHDKEDVAPLRTVDCGLALRDVYLKVDFPGNENSE